MEQQLDATYLRHGLVERAAAVGISAVCIGIGILLAAWGSSLLWHYTPPEIAVRVANPELHVTQDSPLKVSQDKPFVVIQSEPLKIYPAKVIVRDEEPSRSTDKGIGTSKTAAGDVIRREVTVFSNVEHGAGLVVTGWNYRDGSGGIPVQQFCYYTSPNVDRSSKRVDIAFNNVRSFDIDAELVPDLDEALRKCQWWQR
jgi:hypothetical protein